METKTQGDLYASQGVVMGEVHATPYEVRDVAGAETRAKAALRQGVWEVSQFFSEEQIRDFFEGVLREIASDAP